MYIADTFNHSIRRVDIGGIITTVAGCGRKGYSGDGGKATEATMNEPYGVAVDRDGTLYIVDRLNAAIRRIDGKTGIITTLAGTGKPGYSGDGGPANKAQLREPNGLALDGKGGLLIADVADNRVRRVELSTGTIETICGTGRREFTGDEGIALGASINGARAVDVDRSGNIYICEREGNRIRLIDRAGFIHTIAGTGKAGYSGDGGPALQATFNGPKWIHAGPDNSVYVVDTENHCVRRIDPKTGVISTTAGSGKPGPAGDGGPAASAQLDRPHGCCVYQGKLYVADTENHRIRVCEAK
jgi:DNA-binding beta-propeller fold protein YncE